MTKTYPRPITAHNFKEAWDYTVRKLREARLGYKTDRIADPIGHFAFLVSFLFCICGMLYTYLQLPGLQALFGKVPVFIDLWKGFSGLLFGGASSIWLQAAICLVVTWVISFVFAFLGAGLVRLTYSPQTPEMPAFPKESENARFLMEQVKTITNINTKTRGQAGIKCNILFILVMAVLATLYIVFSFVGNQLDAEAVLREPLFLVYVLCAVLGLLAGYSIANYPLVMLLKRLCRCQVPPELFKDAESYLKYAIMLDKPAETEVKTDAKV